MKYYLLQSGSSGNSTLIKTKNANILIDCGLTYKTLNERLERVNTDINDIDAILITHEHIDHTKAIRFIDISKVYSAVETLPNYHYNYVSIFETFEIKGVKITVLSCSHDVANGIGFVIEEDNEKLVYLTDTGYVKKPNMKYMENGDCYIFESNYDENMLMSCSRPLKLKKRIKSNKGHLSNVQCGETLSKLIGNKTKNIVLAHISQDCNTPSLCFTTVKSILDLNGIDTDKIKFQVASRVDITEVI